MRTILQVEWAHRQVFARESEQQPAVASLLAAYADDAPSRSRLPRQRQ